MKKILILIIVIIVGLLLLSKDIIINKYKLYRISYDNKHIYDEVFNEYINKQYGLVFNKFKTKYLGVGISSALLSSEKADNFCIIYDIYPPFMQNNFRITIGYDTLKILSDNFYKTLSTDPKFQHLYSEWVKRQVGIDDENVEIDVKCNKVFFDKIFKYDSNEDIFSKSCGRVKSVKFKGVKNNNDINFDNMFLSFEKEYVHKFYENNIMCDYEFAIIGENDDVNLYYKVNDYLNQYSNEHYRTREGYTYLDGIINQKDSEVFSMISSQNEYTNISIVDFNEKTYKYILYDVMLKKGAPMHLFNISNDLINNEEFLSNPYINVLTDDDLLNKTNFNDGYILVEKIIELEHGYRRYKYEIALNEIHFKVNEKKLVSCNVQSKIKCNFQDVFDDNNNNNYIIYKLNENNNWESVCQKAISLNGGYVDINDYIFKHDRPTYDFFVEIENKMLEYYIK